MPPISIYYQNVCGLRTKTGVFSRNISLDSYDVICICESWLIDGISDSELFDNRYLVWRRDRDYVATGQKKGGGVLIAVRRELAADVRYEWCSSAEDLWVTLKLHHNTPRVTYNIHICVVYICDQRGGNTLSAQLSRFSSNLTDIVLGNPADKFIVVGDFNQPYLIWHPDGGDGTLSPSNAQGDIQKDFLDNLFLCNLHQYNYHINENDRLLDLVLSNDYVSVAHSTTPLVKEDPHHKALTITGEFVQLHSLPSRPYVKFLYSSGNFEAINNEMAGVDWRCELNHRPLEDAVAYFYSTIDRLRNTFIPTKTVVTHAHYPPWYKSPLVKILREKAKFHAKFKKYNNLSDHQSFVTLRGRAKELEKQLFHDYIAKIEADICTNPKAFWSYVKSRRQTSSYPSVLKFGLQSSSNGEEIANMFSDYFSSNFLIDTNVDIGSFARCLQAQTLSEQVEHPTADIHSIQICEDEVFRLLKQVDLNKSAGPDHVPPVFITNCAGSLTAPLSILFRRSLESGQVPSVWKSAYITPIHKKGPKDSVENYRPISKLCVFSKVFEKIIHRQLYSALKQNFIEQQHGFLKGRSTSSNLITCSDFLAESMAQPSQVDVIYTDYSKCFDRIHHAILLQKLLSMGIRGNLYRWFTSYVENRCQTVVLNGYSSSAIYPPSGVPQGSLLGPLLFNIFINDINRCFVHSKILLYADDMKIMKKIPTTTDAELLQEDLDRFQDYCDRNKLDLNVTKCYVCTFTRKPNPISYDYRLLDRRLTRVNVMKDLGVTFDSQLLFDAHIDNIVTRASKALGFIIRTSVDFKNIKTIKMLYCSLVRSHLEYGSQVWNPIYDTYIDRIEGIQRRFLRYIQFKSQCYLPNYLSRCKKFHILPLYERRRIADLAFLFKIMNGSADTPELVSKFGLGVPSAYLRRSNLLHTPIARTTYRQNSYVIRAGRTFNEACRCVDIDIFNTSVSKLKKISCNHFFGDVSV